MADLQALDNKLHWYKDAIIYELHIKAFFDSNDDGIGDFNGLMEKLDYLEDLGVTTIWLLPFYPSPLKDDGYYIADYYSINSSYGNIDELKKLLEEAHRRNLKVITELVINHTSDQHQWFQRARTSPRDSEERNYYVWSDNPSKYKDVRLFFRILKAATGPGMMQRNNITGIAFFIISRISILIIQKCRRKFSRSLIFGVIWVLMVFVWMQCLIYTREKEPMERIFPKRMCS